MQARFLSVEPVDRLFDFVASILDPNAPKFSLSIVHEKLEKGKGQDLLDADLAPVATVMIHFDGIRSSSKDCFVLLVILIFRNSSECWRSTARMY